MSQTRNKLLALALVVALLLSSLASVFAIATYADHECDGSETCPMCLVVQAASETSQQSATTVAVFSVASMLALCALGTTKVSSRRVPAYGLVAQKVRLEI